MISIQIFEDSPHRSGKLMPRDGIHFDMVSDTELNSCGLMASATSPSSFRSLTSQLACGYRNSKAIAPSVKPPHTAHVRAHSHVALKTEVTGAILRSPQHRTVDMQIEDGILRT